MAADLGGDPLWVDTGSEQLVDPAGDHRRRDAAARHEADLLARHGSVTLPGGGLARDGLCVGRGRAGAVLARFFFPKHGAVIEDPGTGSACANLGGWLVATGAPRPQTRRISQGEAVARRAA